MVPKPLTNKGSVTRLKILTQARHMLIKQGYGSLVMREVANACNMKLGNLQYYFPSHDTLVKAIIEAELSLDIAVATRILEEDDKAQKLLHRVVEQLLTRWRGDSGVVFSTMYLLVLHDESYRSIYKQAYASYYQLLESAIAQISPGQASQEYRIRARLLCALLDGVPYQTGVGHGVDFLSRVQDQAYNIALGGRA